MRVSVADFTYGYAHALADHVVRPVLFMAYSGQMEWRTRAGDEVAARLGEPLTKDLHAQALRTALDPQGAWIPSVLAAADRRLSEVRRHVPDAGGLVIASDQDSARAYAALLAKITGEKPTVVLSDEKAASKRIAEFAERRVALDGRGPDGLRGRRRAAAGRRASTPRRPPRRCSSRRPSAGSSGPAPAARPRPVFVPSVPSLLGFASELEAQRDHVLGRTITDEDDIFAAERDLLEQAQQGEGASDELEGSFEALGSDARFDHVLFDGASFGHAGEVHVGLGGGDGLPRHPRPARARPGARAAPPPAVRARQAPPGRPSPDSVEQVSTHEQLAVLRRELNGLVAAWHHRTGQAHGITHAALRKECGGPAAAIANAEQLLARIDRIREWAARKTS